MLNLSRYANAYVMRSDYDEDMDAQQFTSFYSRVAGITGNENANFICMNENTNSSVRVEANASYPRRNLLKENNTSIFSTDA